MEELLFSETATEQNALSLLDHLFQTLQQVFYQGESRPQGKVIISLRKEWFAEFNEASTRYEIGTQVYSLKSLNRLTLQRQLYNRKLHSHAGAMGTRKSKVLYLEVEFSQNNNLATIYCIV